MLIRAWRRWRAKAALTAPLWRPGGFLSPTILFDELHATAASGAPTLEPYQGLSAIWQSYAGSQQPNYPAYLVALARERGIELGAILDLACGDGTLTARFADIAPEVVGLDASEPMLAKAREQCEDRRGVALHPGDFRDFRLGRTFDAAVCAFNSLNYLDEPADLSRVLRAVAAHLRPGGLFVFDTITEAGVRFLTQGYYHASGVPGARFVIRFEYDEATRRETSLAILPNGVETHRRMPIDPADVTAAAKGTEFEIEDWFFPAQLLGLLHTDRCCFFVLRKHGDPP